MLRVDILGGIVLEREEMGGNWNSIVRALAPLDSSISIGKGNLEKRGRQKKKHMIVHVCSMIECCTKQSKNVFCHTGTCQNISNESFEVHVNYKKRKL